MSEGLSVRKRHKVWPRSCWLLVGKCVQALTVLLARCACPARTTSSGVPAATMRPPPRAAFGAQVDDPVGLGDHVQVVLDDDHAVAAVHQAVQHADELVHVGHVQAHGGLVQHVQRVRRLLAALG